MNSKKKTIRDFIYLDADKLNSLYSQVFEGVAEQIVKSRLHGEMQSDSQKGGVTKGQIAEAQFSEVKQTIENKVLYDHMYSQLESELSQGILEPSGLTPDNYREVLQQAFMVKVKGKAEIDDYNRVRTFAKDFNKLTGKIAFAELISSLGMSLYSLEALAVAAKGEQKSQIRDLIQRLKNPQKLSQDKGYYQDEELLTLIELLTDMFYPEGFETTITPTEDMDGIVFRGVVDKQWLRVQPALLKALYGGHTEFEWTMVGQITFMPGGELPNSPLPLVANINVGATSNTEGQAEPANETESSATESENKSTELPSMSDAFRIAFGGLRVLERMFLESKQRVEVVMYPLAIYRETLLPARKGPK